MPTQIKGIREFYSDSNAHQAELLDLAASLARKAKQSAQDRWRQGLGYGKNASVFLPISLHLLFLSAAVSSGSNYRSIKRIFAQDVIGALQTECHIKNPTAYCGWFRLHVRL